MNGAVSRNRWKNGSQHGSAARECGRLLTHRRPDLKKRSTSRAKDDAKDDSNRNATIKWKTCLLPRTLRAADAHAGRTIKNAIRACIFAIALYIKFTLFSHFSGEMAERSKAAVSKTVNGISPFGGSNPPLSANLISPQKQRSRPGRIRDRLLFCFPRKRGGCRLMRPTCGSGSGTGRRAPRR